MHQPRRFISFIILACTLLLLQSVIAEEPEKAHVVVTATLDNKPWGVPQTLVEIQTTDVAEWKPPESCLKVTKQGTSRTESDSTTTYITSYVYGCWPGKDVACCPPNWKLDGFYTGAVPFGYEIMTNKRLDKLDTAHFPIKTAGTSTETARLACPSPDGELLSNNKIWEVTTALVEQKYIVECFCTISSLGPYYVDQHRISAAGLVVFIPEETSAPPLDSPKPGLTGGAIAGITIAVVLPLMAGLAFVAYRMGVRKGSRPFYQEAGGLLNGDDEIGLKVGHRDFQKDSTPAYRPISVAKPLALVEDYHSDDGRSQSRTSLRLSNMSSELPVPPPAPSDHSTSSLSEDAIRDSVYGSNRPR